MLQVKTILPGVQPARILVVPRYALPQIGQRPQRGACRIGDAITERIGQRVVWSEEIVLRGDERSGSAETVLPRRLERRLIETASSTTKDGVRPEAVRKSDTRLELFVVRMEHTSDLAILPGEELCAENSE